MSATIGAGVVGTGWMARAHVHALRVVASVDPAARPVRLVIVASSRDDKARSAADAWGAAGPLTTGAGSWPMTTSTW